MPSSMGWDAKDPKTGMTIEELEKAVDLVRQARPNVHFRLKAVVGFGQQVKQLTFEEVEDV